ncbi:MAG: hypothetical protein ACLUDK_10170 [Clostridium paraputrificum]
MVGAVLFGQSISITSPVIANAKEVNSTYSINYMQKDNASIVNIDKNDLSKINDLVKISKSRNSSWRAYIIG